MKVSWKLPDMSDANVVRVATSYLFERLVREEGEAAITKLPERSGGAPAIIQASFLRRLLSEEFELKSATLSDVSAAQSDLRQLSLLQLLAIRVRNIDFATVSVSHSAHKSFLATVDSLLVEKIARRGLGGAGASPGGMRLTADALRSLGTNLMLVIGAAQVLAAEAREGEADAPVPKWWGFRLGGELWAGTPAALFQRETLSVHLVCAGSSGLDVVGDGELVAVAPERGSSRTAAPSWKVVAVDPREVDVLAELLSSNSEDEKGRRLHAELARAVFERAAMRTDLDLEEEKRGGDESEETKSFLVTPPVGKVSAAIRALQGRTSSKQGLGSPPQRARSWKKSGWGWSRSASKMCTDEPSPREDASASSGDATGDGVPALARQLSGDTASSSMETPRCGPQRITDNEELARLLEMFSQEEGFGTDSPRRGWRMQCCAGARDSQDDWSTFLGSFVSCGSRN